MIETTKTTSYKMTKERDLRTPSGNVANNFSRSLSFKSLSSLIENKVPSSTPLADMVLQQRQKDNRSKQQQQQKQLSVDNHVDDHDDEETQSMRTTSTNNSLSVDFNNVTTPSLSNGNHNNTTTPINDNNKQQQPSVKMVLTKLLSIPTNRSCAECRVSLIDTSQIYAALSPSSSITTITTSDSNNSDTLTSSSSSNSNVNSRNRTSNNIGNQSTLRSFRYHHNEFAPRGVEGHHTTPTDDGKEEEEEVTFGSVSDEEKDSSTTKTNLFENKSTCTIIDPAIHVTQLTGGHGVFVCEQCSIAHKSLGTDISIIRSIAECSSWSTKQITFISQGNVCGNLRSWNVYEAYMPISWQQRRPTPTSSIAERELFLRAKYEALAFITPPGGPLSSNAWTSILKHNTTLERYYTAERNLRTYQKLTLHSNANNNNSNNSTTASGEYVSNDGPILKDLSKSSKKSSSKKKEKQQVQAAQDQQNSQLTSSSNNENVAPERLIDYFVVMGHSGRLSAENDLNDISNIKRPQDLLLQPHVIDCYPSKDAYTKKKSNSGSSDSDNINNSDGVMEFPDHISTFVYPDGCRPSETQLAPTFFTFVLTTSAGTKLYGAALQIYDTSIETEELTDIIEESGYTGLLPTWLSPRDNEDDNNNNQNQQSQKNNNLRSSLQRRQSSCSDIVFLPKCLVVVSHYGFLNSYRSFLLQLYRISLVQSPLPIERYITNFVSEVPLPPQGSVQIKFSFTNNDYWLMSRPPVNELPLADFSYRPLFTALSVENIMVVMGCLLQETPVALLCRHYAMLGPVAEALVSLLFPFEWQGLYLPLMPYSMLDVLEAPVPFLVGLHSRYLTETPPQCRPRGVVFVDLDSDVVHLGFDDNGPRSTPSLPDREAAKLKSKLEQYGSVTYISPDRPKDHGLTTGDGDAVIQNADRESYAQKYYFYSKSEPTTSRQVTLAKTEKAFWKNELLTPIKFEQGQIIGTETTPVKPNIRRTNTPIINAPSQGITDSAKRRFFNRKASSSSSTPIVNQLTSNDNILDNDEPNGFNSNEIRHAFLRFFVAVFKNYKAFVDGSETNSQPFLKDDFISDLNLPADNSEYMHGVVSSQMFHSFIETRLANPNEPEVLFFDESIDEKNNRSAMTKMKKGGKKETPFLDDRSGQITETFAPPPPSDWGIPDAGKDYVYSSFPKLTEELYGKVREPRKWPQNQVAAKALKRKKIMSKKVLAKQREIFSKAMRPSNPVSNLTSSMRNVSEKGVRNLEYAIFVLAYRNDSAEAIMPVERSMRLKKDPTIATVKTAVPQEELPNALDLISNARRKEGILLEILTQLQATYRMHIDKTRYKKFRTAIVVIQRRFRGLPMNIQSDSAVANDIITRKLAAETIQRNARASIARAQASAKRKKLSIEREKVLQLHSAILIQSHIRAFTARRLFIYLRSIVVVQSHIRVYLVRANFLYRINCIKRIQEWARRVLAKKYAVRLERGILKMQALFRGRRERFAFTLVRELIVKVQACIRGYRTRKKVSSLIVERMRIYRQHMVVLWKRTYTPLAYRSKLWAFAKGCQCLHINMTEKELERLWNELDVSFCNQSITESKRLYQQDHISIDNDIYWKFLEVQASLDSGKQFPGESKESGNAMRLDFASERLQSEQLQIYEKLDAFTDKEKLNSIYMTFKLASSEKEKKVKLPDLLWGSYENAEESMSFMISLFPELKTSPDIAWVKPSKKGLKRFKRGSHGILEPLNESMDFQSRVADRIRSNMREFAIARLHVNDTNISDTKCNDYDKRRRDALVATRNLDWPSCRRIILFEYLYKKKKLAAVSNKGSISMGTVPGQQYLDIILSKSKMLQKSSGVKPFQNETVFKNFLERDRKRPQRQKSTSSRDSVERCDDKQHSPVISRRSSIEPPKQAVSVGKSRRRSSTSSSEKRCDEKKHPSRVSSRRRTSISSPENEEKPPVPERKASFSELVTRQAKSQKSPRNKVTEPSDEKKAPEKGSNRRRRSSLRTPEEDGVKPPVSRKSSFSELVVRQKSENFEKQRNDEKIQASNRRSSVGSPLLKQPREAPSRATRRSSFEVRQAPERRPSTRIEATGTKSPNKPRSSLDLSTNKHDHEKATRRSSFSNLADFETSKNSNFK